jgi:hypothetical protein
MNEHRSRPFFYEERAFLKGVAAKLPPKDGECLRHGLQIATGRLDGDFLLVNLPGYERPDYKGHHNLPFEGKMRAADGGAMTVLVNMDQNGRLLAVEFIRWESLGSVAPDWSTLSIVPEPPTGNSKS